MIPKIAMIGGGSWATAIVKIPAKSRAQCHAGNAHVQNSFSRKK